MARGKLWEVAILYHPKTIKNSLGEDVTPPSVIVKAPEIMMAATEKEVGIKASREIPTEYDDKIEEIEICIRPF